MNKCLVTRLKAMVDNPDLPYFGSFILHVPAGPSGNADSRTWTLSGPGITLKVVGHDDWENYISTNHPNGGFYFNSEEAFDLIVIDNYGLTVFNNEHSGERNQNISDFSALKYRKNLKTVYIAYTSVLHDSIVTLGGNTALTHLNFTFAKNVVGSIEDFAEAQISNGRKEGSVSITGPSITYGGVKLGTGSKTVTFSTTEGVTTYVVS